MSLAECFPMPMPVTIGGRRLLACQFRIAHLARLDAWCRSREEGPFSLARRLPDADPLGRRLRLRKAFDLAGGEIETGFGSPQGDRALFGTLPGRDFFLSLALRPSRLAAEDLVHLAQTMTPEEWGEVERVAFAIDPFAEISRMIDDELGIVIDEEQVVRKRTDWRGAVSDLHGRFGWASPAAVRRLYLSQWRLLLSGGEPPEHSDRLTADPAFNAEIQAKRAAFWAEGAADKARASVAVAEDDDAPEFDGFGLGDDLEDE